MPKILSAVACNLDTNILAACLPLMEESRVEAIEWSFDALYKVKEVPSWFRELLTAFSDEKRLIGHGVFFSLFSGKWLPEQENWLKQLEQTAAEFRFDHITEHFGFMTGKDFHHGAPLNIPYTATTLNIGRDRLKRIYNACRVPVGLENLAFSYSLDEVKRHGAFLEQLLEPVNGFIILDLHNLYCQLRNFDIAFDEMIALYPLDRVREIHISGGSWEDSAAAPERSIRRDTHDDAVPSEVFQLLEMTIGKCPQLKYVVMEQLGNGLVTDASRRAFYDDFLQMEEIVRKNSDESNTGSSDLFLPLSSFSTDIAVEDMALYQQQLELSSILESAVSYEDAMQVLTHSSLANSDWQIEQWEPYMIETAVKIAQKWKK
ncbi:DUF692 family multinuclear iron-containing protein [Chitinophaga sp. S165]|uniref:multinuclear nonheme iron-dependent oxidase n=1 Tax=Chitinophaga sp. S165 TaxID=2135462 RepID=UPI000D9D8A09|nr:DUF692 family multinuclear iron-containing protein [Chitinophaga sp. S165]PWV46518.1 uncharacterized protein (UPF0276 family) [Chitinophaga sp. S165]